MLDYAANGVAYWPIDQLTAAFEAMAISANGSPEQRLGEFLEDGDPDAFWRQVESNLRAGRIRMVFVADKIGHELRRIIEFLNEQMRPAEMLAIEVEQHTTPAGLRLLTPRVVGNTERAMTAKAVRVDGPKLDVEDWLDDLGPRYGEEAMRQARAMRDWFVDRGFEVGLTKTQDALFARLTRPDGRPTWPFFIRRSTGRLETSLQYLKDNPAFAADSSRQEILSRILELSSDVVATPKLTGWPAIPLASLALPGVKEGFAAVAETIIARNAGT